MFETSNSVALVLEFIQGGSLCDRIESEGAYEWQEAVRLIDGILKGLGALHRSGIVHRDMKPDNVLLAVDHDGEVTPKVTDLGIAHDESATRLTRDGSRLGTPEYMSPEQVRGQSVDVRSDLYSTGIVLYEMLMGEVPFSGTDYDIMHGHASQVPDLDRLPTDVPEWLRNALAVSMAKTPEERFQTYSEFREALSPDRPVDASRIPKLVPPPAPNETGMGQAQLGSASDDSDSMQADTGQSWDTMTKGFGELETGMRFASYGLMVHLIALFSRMTDFLDSDLQSLVEVIRNGLFLGGNVFAIIGLSRLTKAPDDIKGRDFAMGGLVSMCLVPILLFFDLDAMSKTRDMEFKLLMPCIALGAAWLFIAAFFVRMGEGLKEEALTNAAVNVRNLVIGVWFVPILIAAYSENEYAQPVLMICCVALLIRQADLLQTGATHTNLLSGEW